MPSGSMPTSTFIRLSRWTRPEGWARMWKPAPIRTATGEVPRAKIGGRRAKDEQSPKQVVYFSCRSRSASCHE
jgi:hypothetical protein